MVIKIAVNESNASVILYGYVDWCTGKNIKKLIVVSKCGITEIAFIAISSAVIDILIR